MTAASAGAARRYVIAVIDDELAALTARRLDMRRDDPRRPGLCAQIDRLLDQRNEETARGH